MSAPRKILAGCLRFLFGDTPTTAGPLSQVTQGNATSRSRNAFVTLAALRPRLKRFQRPVSHVGESLGVCLLQPGAARHSRKIKSVASESRSVASNLDLLACARVTDERGQP